MVKPTSALLILVLCIAGYSFFHVLPATKYKIKRTTGYHTFLYSAGGGLLLFMASSFIFGIGVCISKYVEFRFSLGDIFLNDLLKCEAVYTNTALFDIGVVTLILGRLLPFAFAGITEEKRFEVYTKYWYSDPETPEFTKLFFKSLEYGRPILFTMSDSKVYIGYVFEIYAADFNDILIIPYYSGYRDKDTRELHLVTPYKNIIHDIENKEKKELDLEAFLISLPIRDISHAHLHDFNYHSDFQHEENKLKRAKKKRRFVKLISLRN